MAGRGLQPRRKAELARILGIQVWDRPDLYLGMPNEWGRSKTRALNWIKEKILNKIQGWKGNLLNQAGKETLIKAVLQAIPTYAMSILKFPKTFCSQICARIAQFWWKGKKQRGIHWKKWEILTYSKDEGGMGFKDFETMNQAHLAKQAWRIIQEPQALWVQILRGIYFPASNFLEVKQKRHASWTWSSILHGRTLILNHGQWSIGDGREVSIMGQKWVAANMLLKGGPEENRQGL